MADPLFYYPQLNPSQDVISLSGSEARHAQGARRLRAGDTVSVFNGCGLYAKGRITATPSRKTELALKLLEHRTAPAPPLSVHLCCALPKGDRQAVLLDAATQLGMASFTGLDCTRSVVKPSAKTPERWQRICLEACKQSHRYYLPEIHPGTSPGKATARAAQRGCAIWIAHPLPDAARVGSLRLPKTGELVLIVGPEGGFTEPEINEMTGLGGQVVGLGATILRIETAALALLAYALLSTGGQDSSLPQGSNNNIKASMRLP